MDNTTPPLFGPLTELTDAVARANEAYDAGKHALVAYWLMVANDFLVNAQQDSINAWRDHGATWADVGDMFGISRQAAHKAWG